MLDRLRQLLHRKDVNDAKERLLRSAVVGAHFTCGPLTTAICEGAPPGSIQIGDYVTMMEAELRCFAKGSIKIGDYCWFSPRTQIISCSRVQIGRYCIVARDVYISDTNEHPIDPMIRRQQTIDLLKLGRLPDRYEAATKPIEIGDDVWLGERACILKGVRIGNGVVVGCNAVVTKDVPPNVIVAGNPARVVGEVPAPARL